MRLEAHEAAEEGRRITGEKVKRDLGRVPSSTPRAHKNDSVYITWKQDPFPSLSVDVITSHSPSSPLSSHLRLESGGG